MAINISNRNYCKDARHVKRNQEILSDETALRDEIFDLKRQVMILRRTNEQNLVKFRKYEDEAKRKDREIEQLMDPRKNADVTKVLSTKGAAILMTLKDQNNALIQMVLNKDVQIRRLLAEMKMSKLYASTRKNVSYKEEIARLKNLLLKSQEKLKENVDKENQAKSMCANENSFLEFSSSSSGQSSPRDLDELRLVIRSLESHVKRSNDLLNKKDQEISVLTDEVNLLKKLLQHKTSKNKTFECHPIETHKYSITDTHSVAQTRDSDAVLQLTKISAAELFDLFENSPDAENKSLTSSARLPSSNDFTLRHQSLTNVTGNENWNDSKTEAAGETKTDATLLRDIAVGEDSNEPITASKLVGAEKVRERKKILTKHREPKKRIPKKFSGSAKKKKFYENEKKTRNVFTSEAFESKSDGKKGNGQMKWRIFKIMDSKENEEMNTKPREIFSKTKNSESDKDDPRTSAIEIEEPGEIQRDSSSLTVNSCGTEKQSETLQPVDNSGKNVIMGNVSGVSSEIIEINLAGDEGNSKTNDEDAKSINFRREIYRQNFDSSFESDNGYPTKQEVQQVQVEVQIDSILMQNDGDESENSISENSHQGEFPEKRGDNCAPDDNDDNNDDDNDVIIR